jgi:hypothetical protein
VAPVDFRFIFAYARFAMVEQHQATWMAEDGWKGSPEPRKLLERLCCARTLFPSHTPMGNETFFDESSEQSRIKATMVPSSLD